MRKRARASATVIKTSQLSRASTTMRMRKKEKKRVKRSLRRSMTSKNKALNLATTLMIHRVW